jgi:hypothetical protein
MSLSPDQVKHLKAKIQKKIEQDPRIAKQLNFNVQQLATMPAEELEKRLDSRILGILGLSKKDLGEW